MAITAAPDLSCPGTQVCFVPEGFHSHPPPLNFQFSQEGGKTIPLPVRRTEILVVGPADFKVQAAGSGDCVRSSCRCAGDAGLCLSYYVRPARPLLGLDLPGILTHKSGVGNHTEAPESASRGWSLVTRTLGRTYSSCKGAGLGRKACTQVTEV